MSAPYRVVVAGPGGLGLYAIREIQRLLEIEKRPSPCVTGAGHSRRGGRRAGLLLPALPQFHSRPDLRG